MQSRHLCVKLADFCVEILMSRVLQSAVLLKDGFSHSFNGDPMRRLLAAWRPVIILVATAASQDAAQAPIQLPPDSFPTLLVRKVAPHYPSLARQARIQGTVVLSIVINKDGEVRDVKLVSGHPMLSAAAIEAVKQWRYRPYISDDKPAEVETVVRVGFRMADGPEISTPGRSQQRSAPREGIPQLARVSAGIVQGLLEHKVDPEYPAEAQEKHVEGTVVLNVDIDDEGNVGRVELVSGHSMLAPSAMDAVLEWRYRPFVLNGAAVPVETTIEVKFALAE